MRRPGTPSADDRGAVLVWVILMMVVLLGIAAFAVDLGMGLAVKRQLSATADSTALAGAQEAGLKFKSAGGCVSTAAGYEPSAALVAAVNAAVAENHAANAPWGSDGAPVPTITCDPTQVTVAVGETSTLDTIFGGILGLDTLNPGAAATANVFGSNYQGGLRPFTVCVDDARLAGAEPGPTKSTRDTAYVNHNSATPTTVPLGSGTWVPLNDTISMGSSHNLDVGDWVEVVDNNDGAYSGFYYVKTVPTSQTLTVTESIGYAGPGTIKDVTSASAVPLDLYKVTEGLVGGGASNWAKNDDAITETGHGLSVAQTVRVVVTQGATPAFSALYDVASVNPAGNKFTLTGDLGNPVDITANGKADVYLWDPDASGPTSSACAAAATAAPGNWGYARFDLSGNQPTLKCLVEFGYGGGDDCDDGSATGIDLGDDNASTPEVTSDGNTGNSINSGGNWITLLDGLVNEVILLPVAEVWNQNGSNAQYTAKGGAAVRFCGYMIPKNDNTAEPPKALNNTGSCWDGSLYATALANWADATSLYIQWQYVDEYVGVYLGQGDSSGETCALGDATCIPTLRLIG